MNRFETLHAVTDAAKKARSTWERAIYDDAVDMLENIDNAAFSKAVMSGKLNELLLNGARDWKEYSHGGSALIYDGDIARHYCTPSEFKKTDGGNRNPNKCENWLDVQARALRQAARIVCNAAYAK